MTSSIDKTPIFLFVIIGSSRIPDISNLSLKVDSRIRHQMNSPVNSHLWFCKASLLEFIWHVLIKILFWARIYFKKFTFFCRMNAAPKMQDSSHLWRDKKKANCSQILSDMNTRRSCIFPFANEWWRGINRLPFWRRVRELQQTFWSCSQSKLCVACRQSAAIENSHFRARHVNSWVLYGPQITFIIMPIKS
jgi:hypothetical protein